MKEGKSKGGRPTIYTPKLAKEICDTIACSSRGIKRLCSEREHWPNPDTIYTWVTNRKDFSEQYAQAKRHQIEVIIDEILDIADDTSNDNVVNEDGKIVTDHEHINRSRLRIDTRKWIAAKLAPKVYGDKTISETKVVTTLSHEEALKQLA